MKRKFLLLMLTLSLAGFAFTGCTKGQEKGASQPKQTEDVKEQKEEKVEEKEEVKENKEEKKDKEEVSLSSWEEVHPVWESITNFYSKDYLKQAAEKKAKEKGKKAEEILKEHEEGAHTEVAAIEFSGNKITLKDKTGKELASSEYKYVKTIGKGVEHGEFAIFEATGDVKEEFKAIALMEPHGGEGDITHFHARFAKSVDDKALEDKDWWPVYVDPASTQEQVINEILGQEE